MTIKTIKSSNTGHSTDARTLVDRLKTALVDWQRGWWSRKEIAEGKHCTSASTSYSEGLLSSDVLNETAFGSAIQHSEIKKADGSSADKKHSSVKEHKSNLASSSVTPAPDDNSVNYQASRAQSGSDDEVSASCPSLKLYKKLVTSQRQPSSRLDHIGISVGVGLALTGGCLIGAGVGVVIVGVGAGVAAALGAGGAAVLGSAVGAAAGASAVGAAVGTGIAAGVDAISVDAGSSASITR